MRSDLSRGRVIGKILSFALPLALGMASHAAFNLVDLFIVGRLGEDAVAAVHLAGTINFFPMILGNGISVGSVAVIAVLLGQMLEDRARRVANLSLWLMMATSAVLGLACYLAAQPLVEFQAGTGVSLQLGTEYLEIASLGTFTMFLLMHVTGVLRAMGNARWTVVLLIGANGLNIVLDVVLIFGVEPLGIPALGVAGAAWASVSSRAVGGIVGLLLLARRDCPLTPGWAMPAVKAEALRRIAWLGVPQSMQMFVRASLILTMTRIAGRLAGSTAQAALGVTTRLDTFILFAAVGWASGATAMVGQCAGKGLHARCQAIAWATSGFAGVLAFFAGLVFAVGSRPLCLLFVPGASEELLGHGLLYLTILAFAHPAASTSLVLAGAWNGAGHSFKPMLLDVVAIGMVLQPALWIWEWGGAAGGLGTCWTLVLAANWLLLSLYCRSMRGSDWAVAAGTPAKLSGVEEQS